MLISENYSTESIAKSRMFRKRKRGDACRWRDEIGIGLRRRNFYKKEHHELLSAAKTGNLELTRQLLQSGTDLYSKPLLRTCLHYATKHNNEPLWRELLSAGADPDIGIFNAVSYENFDLLKLILDNRPNPRATIHHAVIFKAVDLQRADLVKLLLESGMNPNSTNKARESILTYAVKSRINNPNINNEAYVDIIRLFLVHGADIRCYAYSSPHGPVSVNAVLKFGTYDAVRLFFKYGLKSDRIANLNPLHTAVKNQDGVLEYLLEHSHLNVNDVDFGRHSVLHQAVIDKNVKNLEILLQHGADLEIPNNANETPLVTATNRNHLECVKLLLEYGANVNHVKANCQNPWFFAAHRNHAKCFELLLSHGAEFKFDELLFDDILQSINSKTMKVLLRHIALLESGPYEINPDYYKFMVERDLTNKNNLGLNYLNDCKIELGLLQTSVIQDTRTFYNILTCEIPDHLLTDEQVIKIFELKNLINMFPIFGKQMCDIFDQAKRKRDFEVGVIRGLNKILRFDAGSFHMVGENILKRLYKRDLRNLCRV